MRRTPGACPLPLVDNRACWLGALIGYATLIAPDGGGVGLPCLFRLTFGFDCFGCGLSRAGTLLLRGRVLEAAEMNALIFPVVLLVAREFVSSCFNVCRRIRPCQNSAQLKSAR